MPKTERNPQSETRIETLVAAGVPPAIQPDILPGGLACGLLRHLRIQRRRAARRRPLRQPRYLFSALRALCCSADFQSAVSPTCSRRSVGSGPRTGVSHRLAECNSAIQQSTTLRYARALNTHQPRWLALHPQADAKHVRRFSSAFSLPSASAVRPSNCFS